MKLTNAPLGRVILYLLPLALPSFVALADEAKSNDAAPLALGDGQALVVEIRKKDVPAVEIKRAEPATPATGKAPAVAEPRRWPVQILSAIYGTGGKEADVTKAVREHVEIGQRAFGANPRDLGADPNPGWNKSLRITYMKDGVRREQRRNENETILPESFYGPQDAHELRDWLAATRWAGAKNELQFNADHTATGPGLPETLRWEALSASKLRLIWSEDRREEFAFDYRWNRFSEVGNARNVFNAVR